MAKKKSESPKSLGVLVKEYRTKYGLTQEQLGALVGLSDRYISQIENSRVSIPESTANGIVKVLAEPPAELPALANHGISQIRSMVRSHSEVYQALRELPNGTKFFLIAASDLRETLVPERTLDLLENLKTNQDSEWHFLYPKETALPRELTFVRSIAHGSSQVAEAKELIKAWLAQQGFQKLLSDQANLDAYTRALDRVQVKPLDLGHYFHPIVRLILAVPPAEATRRSDEGECLGWLEIPFYYSNLLPAMIRLAHLEINEILTWLSAAGVDVLPKAASSMKSPSTP